jgi:hypothetical protein
VIPPTREVFRGKWFLVFFGVPGNGGTRIAPNSGFPTCHIQRQYAEDTQWHPLGEDSPDDTRPAGLCYRVFLVGEFGGKKKKKEGWGEPGARGAAAHGYAGPGKAENTYRVSCPRALSRGVFPGTLDKTPPQQKKVWGVGEVPEKSRKKGSPRTRMRRDQYVSHSGIIRSQDIMGSLAPGSAVY